MASIVWDAVTHLALFEEAIAEADRYYVLTPQQQSVLKDEVAAVEQAWGRIHDALYGPGATLVRKEEPS